MYWEYEIDGDANRLERNRVASKKHIQGGEWYELVEYGESFWVRNGRDGQQEAQNLYNTQADDVKEIDEILVYKYPFDIGESYKSGIDVVKVLGEQEVTVPAGSFRCTIFHIDMSEGNYSRNCIAKGVGVVQNEFYYKGKLSVSRLVEYGVE